MNFLINNVNDRGSLNEEFIEKLKKLKAQKKDLSLTDFVKKLQELFLIDKIAKINTDYKRFLGGFILGEGSLNASLKKKNELSFGVVLDLEFSVTQTFYGISHLINLITVFNTGNISYKVGSNATFVFDISNRKSIFEKVFPFWEKYILPYQTNFEAKERFLKFKQMKDLFDNNAHKEVDGFLTQMLPLWDSLRKQKGQSNQSFESLEAAQNYVKNHMLLKNK